MTIKELYEQINNGYIVSDIGLQREIVYSAEKQALVIDSIIKGIPLPAFYFWENEDGILEVLDGKQRIEAITKFPQNNLQYKSKNWKQYDSVTQEKFYETPITAIICSGTEELKREIFYRINTLGVPLSQFEILNGLYHGEYLRGATGTVKNDKNIEKVLGTNSRGKNQLWLLKKIILLQSRKENIYDYVKEKQHISFQADYDLIKKHIRFIKEIFDNSKELDIYFNLAVEYEKDFNIWLLHKTEINKKITEYLKDKTRLALTDKPKEIKDIIQVIVNNISVDPKRLFTLDDKKVLLREQTPQDEKYKCSICSKYFYDYELEMDHIEAWCKGGRTQLSNAQLLCNVCNVKKGKS